MCFFTLSKFPRRWVNSLILLITLSVFVVSAVAQKITVSGKVTDSHTGEAIPYATIAVKGTSIGTNSDFDGLFSLLVMNRSDSITVSSIGYLRQSYVNSGALNQKLLIRLSPSSQSLHEVMVTAPSSGNPAWKILRQVITHKSANDPHNFTSFQYETYTRIELDASHLSNTLLKKKYIDKAVSIAKDLNISSVNDLPVLPLYLSESSSDFFFQRNPELRRENIKKTKTNGIGFEDGTLLAQLTGSTFQQYNFYKNFVSAAGKDFVSPITDSWQSWYSYDLENRNAIIDGKVFFQISFKPKRPQDLAFSGTMWIDRVNFALYQIKATVEPTANLNFIHKISIQQQMDGVQGRAWLPSKIRILVEVDQLGKNSSGLLAKFYAVNKNAEINKKYPADFFKERIVVSSEALVRNEHYWDANRPDSLTAAELSVYGLIDTVKAIPTVKTYLSIADLLINGYYRLGKISLGPILQTYSYNNIEGSRFRLGLKTNSNFSNKYILGAYAAYGTKDRDVKFGLSADYIFSRKNWTEGGISFSRDLNLVALLSDSYFYQRNNLFSAFTRFGRIDTRKAFDQNLFTLYLRRDLFKGFTEKVTFVNWSLDPLFLFQFSVPKGGISQELHVSELQFESRWLPGTQQLFSETFNRPLNLNVNASLPVLTFRYTIGLKNVLASDFSYHKFSFNLSQTLKMGTLGRGKYSFSAGFIPSKVPFPLLENHLGNETFIYNPNAFNLMHFFEFASDRYASLQYTQHFEGLLVNSVSVLRQLKWRLVGTANILFSKISPANLGNEFDRNVVGLRSLGTLPYIELGYGVENIFRFIRVDFIHRLTYRENIGSPLNPVKNFGIMVSAQIRL